MRNCNNTDILDAISLMSFIIQMQNLEDDKRYKGSVQEFKDFIQEEVNKLHMENELIMNKLDRIQAELKEMKYR